MIIKILTTSEQNMSTSKHSQTSNCMAKVRTGTSISTPKNLRWIAATIHEPCPGGPKVDGYRAIKRPLFEPNLQQINSKPLKTPKETVHQPSSIILFPEYVQLPFQLSTLMTLILIPSKNSCFCMFLLTSHIFPLNTWCATVFSASDSARPTAPSPSSTSCGSSPIGPSRRPPWTCPFPAWHASAVAELTGRQKNDGCINWWV